MTSPTDPGGPCVRPGAAAKNAPAFSRVALRKIDVLLGIARGYRSRCKLGMRRAARCLWNALFCGAVSTVVAMAVAYLCSPSVQAQLSEANGKLGAVYLAAGGLIGTSLALVFSLSVIAVQRAAEAFSPSITQLYRNDWQPQAVFIALAVFCILSFIMGTGALIALSDSILLPIQIILVGFTFDLLRWHYRRLGPLFLPREAIGRLLEVIRGYIGRTQSTVARFARVRLQAMPEDQRAQVSAQGIEAAVYAALPNHPAQIIQWTGELAEAAVKAVARQETDAARLAVSGLADVATCYLTTRRENVTLRQLDSLLAMAAGMAGSDVDVVLSSVYEHLKDINRRAIALDSEATCIDVVRAFGRIASQTARLDSPAFAVSLGGHRAPITRLPLGWLKECALAAQRHGFQDAVLEAARALVAVTRETPTNIPAKDVWLPVARDLRELAVQSLLVNQGVLANEVLKAMLEGMHDALDRGHTQIDDIVRHTLDEIKAMAPLALASAAAQGMLSMGMPLSPVYDLIVESSIGNLVLKSARAVMDATAEDQSDACKLFYEINEIIGRHLRSLADDVAGVGSTFLMVEITLTIKKICETYSRIIRQVPDEAEYPGRRLADQVPWYLSFFWAVFAKATTVPEGYARDACNTLAEIGLAFCNLGETSVAETSVTNICSVAESYWKDSKGSNPHVTADMLSFVYCVRRLAEARCQNDLVQKVDTRLNRFAVTLGDRWREVKEAYERDTSRLEEEIGAPDFDQLMAGGAVLLLVQLLRQTGNDKG